jgi:hypothetical protein
MVLFGVLVIVMSYGFYHFPAAPTRYVNGRYVDKSGHIHSREDFEDLRVWERIPAATKRAVWARDRGQCAFIGVRGRCEERGFLEFHHVEPFAEGGETSAENLELRCRAHNAHEARLHFGPVPFPSSVRPGGR